MSSAFDFIELCLGAALDQDRNIAVIDFRVTEIFPDKFTCSDFEFVPQDRAETLCYKKEFN